MPELIDSADVVALPLTGTEELIIGILLCDRPVLDTWVESLNALRSPLRRGTIAVRSAGRDKLREIQAARTGITERALKVGARWLFFLDDDVIVAPNTLEELLAALRSNPRARIMGGIYGSRGNLGSDPGVFKSAHEPFLDYPRGRPFTCAWMAGGCMLIDLRVFASIPKPWYRYEIRGQQLVKGEDEWLCGEVRRLGYEVMAHGGVVCPHLDARLETSDFKGRDPWTVRYFNGRYVDQAGNVLRKSQLGGSI
jgi:hypothetical protein